MTDHPDRHDPPPASEEPETAAGEVARRCGLCGAELAGDTYTLGARVICPGCARDLEERQAGRGRWRRALVWGGLAALALASLWYLATRASSRPLPGIALLAGIAIGLVVHRGANGRGGLRYQLAAALLVYAAFVARYVPPVFGGIAAAIEREHAPAAPRNWRETPPEPPTAPPPGAPASAAAEAPRPESAPAGPSTLATLKAYLVYTAVAWALVLAAPFLPGSFGVLSVISLALGMAAAAYLNRRVRPRGPFSGEGS